MPLIDSKNRGIAPQLPLVEQGKGGREGERKANDLSRHDGAEKKKVEGREGGRRSIEDEAVDLQT